MSTANAWALHIAQQTWALQQCRAQGMGVTPLTRAQFNVRFAPNSVRAHITHITAAAFEPGGPHMNAHTTVITHLPTPPCYRVRRGSHLLSPHTHTHAHTCACPLRSR